MPSKLYEVNLSVEGIALYCYLSCCREDFNPSLRFVNKVLGMSINRIRKAYKELEEKNMIKCYHKGYKNTTKKYEFVQVEMWK